MNLKRAHLPIPGLLWGDHPERSQRPQSWLERCNAVLHDLMVRLGDSVSQLPQQLLLSPQAHWLAQVRAAQTELAAMPHAMALQKVQFQLLRLGLTPEALTQAMGLVVLFSQRSLGLQPFDTQLIAAHGVLDNQLAEMATGEGKTLAVGLAAAIAALAGMPVHVVTANDYLVARDAQRLQPLYAALGLRVGWVTQAHDASVRDQAYACHITYVTANELVFDYLRDGLARLPLQVRSLRGLCMAIVDEADAILIDEARVPLILSQADARHPTRTHPEHALRFARELTVGTDFTLDPGALVVTLTAQGREWLDKAAHTLAAATASLVWHNRQHRENNISTALAALHLYQRDRHYLVRDGKVQLIDGNTGRVAKGRVWSNGLQQFIELIEDCPPSPAMVTLAQLTFQRFFPRYVRLGGLSGTLREARSELLRTYGLSVRCVPLRKPCLRQVGTAQLFKDHASLWQAVAERVAQLHCGERPILVATDGVAESQALAHQLALRALPFVELHARNDQDEARTIARAGRLGAITITTNISGRGTDIELGPGVAARGGLHVICCQLNSAQRIDRQLAGRAARQGDPGSVQTMLSLDTGVLASGLSVGQRRLLRWLAPALPSWAVRALIRGPQRAEEQRQCEQRQRLIAQDERIERQLGFGRPSE